jgi:hypothetical protein
MERSLRSALLKGIPDIRTARDLSPRDRLPEDPEDSQRLSNGEKFWLTSGAPMLHRQLLQALSFSVFLTQECVGAKTPLNDGSVVGLLKDEVVDLCSSLSTLLVDSIRSIVNLQRQRILQASGRKIPSVAEAQRKIISDSMEETMAKQAEREMNLKLARPSTMAQLSNALIPTRRPRFSTFQRVRQSQLGTTGKRYDPEVNSTPTVYPRKSRSFFPYPRRERGGRGRGRRPE